MFLRAFNKKRDSLRFRVRDYWGVGVGVEEDGGDWGFWSGSFIMGMMLIFDILLFWEYIIT